MQNLETFSNVIPDYSLQPYCLHEARLAQISMRIPKGISGIVVSPPLNQVIPPDQKKEQDALEQIVSKNATVNNDKGQYLQAPGIKIPIHEPFTPSGVVRALDGSKILFPDPLERNMDLKCQRESPHTVIFVSALEFSNEGEESKNMAEISLLSMEYCNAAIIVIGNSINTSDSTFKASAREEEDFFVLPAPISRKNVPSCVDQLDRFLNQLSAQNNVALIPGMSDPTLSALPQPPVHPGLLKLSGAYIHSATNPGHILVGSRDIIALSGCISEQMGLSGLQCLREILKSHHICPPCPEYVEGIPVKEKDPLVLNSAPAILCLGGQKKFEREKVGETELLCVPSFAKTQEVVEFNAISGDYKVRKFFLENVEM